MKNRCIICRNDAGNNRVCNICYLANFKPCEKCGKPTAIITKDGGRRKNPFCSSCTASVNAYTRVVGKRCKVCGIKRHDVEQKYQVCPDCLSIKTLCSMCNKPMPKYKKGGRLRKFCSINCSSRAVPKSVRYAAAQKGHITKRATHIYKSHQNRIARSTNQYKEWREAVYKRDNYTCQDCGAHNFKGNGKTIEIHPHHIKPFATYPELRYDVSNGITLCKLCHRKRHKHVFIGKTKRASNQS